MNKDPFYPMMVSYEVRALERLLLSLPSVQFAEWGSGRSTIYFTRLLKKHGIPYTWVSVDHDQVWHDFVRKELADDPNVILVHVPAKDAERYVQAPRKLVEEHFAGRSYDIALVDGLASLRGACIEEAKSVAKTVLVHDAQRKIPGAVGTFIAGRLLRIGPPDPLSRFIQTGRYKIHEKLWKIKQALI